MVSKSVKDRVWQKAAKSGRKDPAQFRKDPYGNEICYRCYGYSSPKGWEIDHIKPKSKGGTDALWNLQALSTRANRSVGNNRRKASRHRQSKNPLKRWLLG